MFLQIFLIGLLLVLIAYFASSGKPAGIPPGRWGWPIIGHLPSKDVHLGDQVLELRKKHGDIISWRMGSRLFIFLCNYRLIKSVMSRQDTTDRPDFYSIRLFSCVTDTGLANISGQRWAHNRRFALRHLKDLGMGKSYLGESIEKEAGHLVQDFRKYLNRPTTIPWSISVAVLNVIWQLAAGKRYEVDDETITSFSQMVLESSKGMEGPVIWVDLFPSLLSVLPFAVRSFLGMHTSYDLNLKLFNFIMDGTVEEHIANLDRDNPKDFIDAYLVEMEKQKNDPNTTMSLVDLGHVVIDLFSAGSLTTAVTLRWTILLLAKYPEVQKRAQKEIDSVVSRDVLPSYSQKDCLPYVEAVTHEVARLATLVPTGVPHCNEEEIVLEGYRIPKNSVLVPHQECCHKDPSYWEKPDEFYPEHFLDENGKFSRKKEGYLPFSVGRRLCVGESLARMELFLFAAALIQNFTFSAPKGEVLNIEKSPTERLITFPKPFKVIITERE